MSANIFEKSITTIKSFNFDSTTNMLTVTIYNPDESSTTTHSFNVNSGLIEVHSLCYYTHLHELKIWIQDRCNGLREITYCL